jgi:quinol monooxygenase YgiN
MTKPISLTATFMAESEADVAYLLGMLKAVVKPTREERGCVRYQLYRDVNNPLRFTFFEVFQNQAALDFHLKQPYLAELLKRKADVYFYDEILV